MPGIYVHIPLCKSICRYCDFYRETDLAHKDGLINALCLEIQGQRGFFGSQAVDTIYFGGGTPSVLAPGEFARLLRTIRRNYQLVQMSEISLEANPDDCSPAYLQGLRKMGVNRISIGTQSFQDEVLEYLGRRHNGGQSQEACRMAREAGFRNISLDLIYGIPGSAQQHWEKDVDTAIALEPEHISAYCLTIEKGSAFYRLQQEGRFLPLVDDETVWAQYNSLIDKLGQAGYEHYEISNFAKAGHYSRHNSNYWMGAKYLGIGPSAHSYNISHRFNNKADISLYISKIVQNKSAVTKEKLSPEDNYNEFIMVRLRTMWGIDLREVKFNFGYELHDYLEKQCRQWIKSGHLAMQGQVLKLTRKGMFLSDSIFADLFV
jgi:oxygen-independent coproporphyrinogen-3 oxidase